MRYIAQWKWLLYVTTLAACCCWTTVKAAEEDYLIVGEDYDEPDYIEVGTGTGDTLTETETTPSETWQTNNTNTDGNRIVGGRQISITEAPYQAVILYNRLQTCGGTVISAVWVLTAAHCVNVGSNSNYGVRAGSSNFKTGGQYRSVAVIATHGRYNPNTNANDIAMIRMRRRFTFSISLRPASIPTASSRVPNRFLISGWGSLTESGTNPTRNLRGTTVNLVPRTLCNAAYATQNYTIRANMLCASASGRDSCQGDSGGPLVNGGIVYGVVSFGIGCARSRFPGVYTNVRTELPWILTVARSFRRALALKGSMKPKMRGFRVKVR